MRTKGDDSSTIQQAPQGVQGVRSGAVGQANEKYLLGKGSELRKEEVQWGSLHFSNRLIGALSPRRKHTVIATGLSRAGSGSTEGNFPLINTGRISDSHRLPRSAKDFPRCGNVPAAPRTSHQAGNAATGKGPNPPVGAADPVDAIDLPVGATDLRRSRMVCGIRASGVCLRRRCR